MRRENLPVKALPLWSKVNNVELDRVAVCRSPDGKGFGIFATDDVSEQNVVLMRLPRELVLSLENVWVFAKSDRQLREILEAAGEFAKTARGAILIFLLMQITSSSPDIPLKVGASNPWSEYVQILPSDYSLPTFWTDEETDLLHGTSLESALGAKLKSLHREFATLRESTRSIEWCNHWWDEINGVLDIEDWKQVDAIYRSRAMDLPGTGLALCACIDMANHKSGHNTVAHYATDAEGNAVLIFQSKKALSAGEEVTITYGEDKGACEMLFSYGFIEETMLDAQSMFLGLDIPDDDPLKLAKKAAFDVAPGFRIFMAERNFGWFGPFVWLQCLNEEDGLEFKVAQKSDRDKELTVSWKGTEIVGISALENCLHHDHSFDLFHLRAVTVLVNRIDNQLSYLQTSIQIARENKEASRYTGRSKIYDNAMRLATLEEKLLVRAKNELEERKVYLFGTNVVQRYLSSDPDEGLAPEAHSDDEDDFA